MAGRSIKDASFILWKQLVSMRASTLPAPSGWSVTLKVASFPSLGVTVASGSPERSRCWHSRAVRGPIWAKPQWMYEILLCSCACLARGRPPPTSEGHRRGAVGWRQGRLALLALDRAQKWRSTHSLSEGSAFK